MKIVLVEWVDSSGVWGWHRFGADDSIARCTTLGIVKSENEKEIVLAFSVSDSGNVETTIAIPKGVIKRIRNLKVR